MAISIRAGTSAVCSTATSHLTSGSWSASEKYS
jgi:hypothetical protein